MSSPSRRFRSALSTFEFSLDPFLVSMIAVVVLASLFPPRGNAIVAVEHATVAAIALLFFLNGLRIPTDEAIAGLKNWRLHAFVLSITFVIFPLIGVAAQIFDGWLLTPALYAGVLFLTTLPSTVQSSIAFTSIAGGNVGAAVCSASLSSMIGIVVSPLLAAWLLGTHGGTLSLDSFVSLGLQVALPFVCGQLLRRWLWTIVDRFSMATKVIDRGSILLVVYSAFGASVRDGVWHGVTPGAIAAVMLVNGVILAIMMCVSYYGSALFGFSDADRRTILFCASKKSLTTGVPIAAVQFSGPVLGLIVLPLILFHQIQIMVCGVVASRLSRKIDAV